MTKFFFLDFTHTLPFYLEYYPHSSVSFTLNSDLFQNSKTIKIYRCLPEDFSQFKIEKEDFYSRIIKFTKALNDCDGYPLSENENIGESMFKIF